MVTETTTIALFGAIIGVYGWLIKITLSKKKNGDYVKASEFAEHKKEVRYTDTCIEIHKGLTRLIDERHQDTKIHLEKIEDLIKKNGNQPPRVQT